MIDQCLHSYNSGISVKEILLQMLLIIVQRGHRRSMRHAFLSFENLPYVITIEDEEQVWMTYETSDLHDFAVFFPQRPHYLVQFMNFVLTLEKAVAVRRCSNQNYIIMAIFSCRRARGACINQRNI